MSQDSNDVSGQIKELQATVRGLTEELVEQNERIRHLEAELEAQTTEETDPETPTNGSNADVPPQKDKEESTNPEFDDIIVA